MGVNGEKSAHDLYDLDIVSLCFTVSLVCLTSSRKKDCLDTQAKLSAIFFRWLRIPLAYHRRTQEMVCNGKTLSLGTLFLRTIFQQIAMSFKCRHMDGRVDFNSLLLGRCDCNYECVILELILWIGILGAYKIVVNWMPQNFRDKSTMVLIMAWCLAYFVVFPRCSSIPVAAFTNID